MNAPLFSVMSQYFGAENTAPHVSNRHANISRGSGFHTGDAPSVVLLLVAIHAHLVAADDGVEAVPLTEPLGDVRAKLQPNTSLAGASSGLVLGIGPEHLHHETGLARLPHLVSIQLPDVVQRDTVVREETAMEHKIFGSNKSCQWQR